MIFENPGARLIEGQKRNSGDSGLQSEKNLKNIDFSLSSNRGTNFNGSFLPFLVHVCFITKIFPFCLFMGENFFFLHFFVEILREIWQEHFDFLDDKFISSLGPDHLSI